MGAKSASLQMELDLEVEFFSNRERYLIKRLGEYRTIDVDIKVQQRLMNGIGLVHEPRVTPKREQDDLMRWLTLIGYDLTSGEERMVGAMKRNLNMADFASYHDGHIRFTHASTTRVLRRLRAVENVESEEERQALDDAIKILEEGTRDGEERLEMTDTEKVAFARLIEREKAKERFDELTERKRIIAEALADMQTYYLEQYLILWHKFVRGERWEKVCELAARQGASLTPDEYRWSRRKALQQFDKWARGI